MNQDYRRRGRKGLSQQLLNFIEVRNGLWGSPVLIRTNSLSMNVLIYKWTVISSLETYVLKKVTEKKKRRKHVFKTILTGPSKRDGLTVGPHTVTFGSGTTVEGFKESVGEKLGPRRTPS